ncbi:hypothetical protein Dda_9324 [Drechslerella dactyloides]|uniref:Uncharacterized protein n=1 Tax=Drechslerella dactyloides TaxID=74499 RepID=A0AAD6NF35_DREDA|nr:hypothetical protein Dda_9324 [Drechslerella dactyloides]
MSASAAPIPLDQFAQVLIELEVPQLHEESSRLELSIYHLERSNVTLAEYPDDEDCKEAIQYNVGVIEQQKQRVGLIRLELGRRGVNLEHAGSSDIAAPTATAATSGSEAQSGEASAGGGSQQPPAAPENESTTNGHVAEEEAGIYL